MCVQSVTYLRKHPRPTVRHDATARYCLCSDTRIAIYGAAVSLRHPARAGRPGGEVCRRERPAGTKTNPPRRRAASGWREGGPRRTRRSDSPRRRTSAHTAVAAAAEAARARDERGPARYTPESTVAPRQPLLPPSPLGAGDLRINHAHDLRHRVVLRGPPLSTRRSLAVPAAAAAAAVLVRRVPGDRK